MREEAAQLRVLGDMTPGGRLVRQHAGRLRRPRQRRDRIWAAEHGLVSLRLARPQFPWSDLDGLVDEAVTKIMGTTTAARPVTAAAGRGINPDRLA
jgi:hypothetical protein